MDKRCGTYDEEYDIDFPTKKECSSSMARKRRAVNDREVMLYESIVRIV